METFVISLFFVALITSLVLLYRHYYVRHKLLRLIAIKHKAVKPLILRLARNEEIKKENILFMVEDPSLRLALYQILSAYNREDLFPVTYLTREKGAESFLVTWLEFPTELGASPSEIIFDSLITIQEENKQDYYAFKYRILPPHWAAQYNWMWGISGPYVAESEPYDSPSKVYSRFNQIASISAEEEVQWVHARVGK